MVRKEQRVDQEYESYDLILGPRLWGADHYNTVGEQEHGP